MNEIYKSDFQLLIVGLFMVGFWGQKSGKQIQEDKNKLFKLYEGGSFDKLRLAISQCEVHADLIKLLTAQISGINATLAATKP